MKFTLCVLLYGDYPDLARRCLNSIWSRLSSGQEYIADIRLGLNAVSPATRSVIDWFTENVKAHYAIPIIQFECLDNACKYPMMRRMLLQDETSPASHVMWFDDDSYLNSDNAQDWWYSVSGASEQAGMLGKIYWLYFNTTQWEFIREQPWFNPDVGKPSEFHYRAMRKSAFKFCTGGWWVVKYEIFKKHDWPPLSLKHCGGDSLLGELCRHQGYKLQNFEDGVRINADDEGRHSKAPRRGYTERPIGFRKSDVLPVRTQDFVCKRTII